MHDAPCTESVLATFETSDLDRLTVNKNKSTSRTSGLTPSGHLVPVLRIWFDARYLLECRTVSFGIFHKSTRHPCELV